jgi:hypothetical protein
LRNLTILYRFKTDAVSQIVASSPLRLFIVGLSPQRGHDGFF